MVPIRHWQSCILSGEIGPCGADSGVSAYAGDGDTTQMVNGKTV